jgi:hypothetical protein
MSKIRIVIGLLLLWAPGVEGARKPAFNVDFFCGWDGWYRPMEWTPVEIQIGGELTEPFAGSFTIAARQDGLTTLNVIHNFVLTPDVPLSLPLVTKFAFAADRCELTIRDERGRTRWDYTYNLWDFSATARLLRAIEEQDLLIGVIGQGQFGLLRLPRDTTCTSDRGQGKVCVGSKVPRVVPWDWTGFVSLDLLVLYDPDWTLLQRQQVKAICEWVSNGGTVLLVLGRHPLPPDSPLNDLVPFHAGEPRQTPVPAAVLAEWDLEASRPETVTAWPLFPKPQAVLIKKTAAPEAGFLAGTGYAGFGRVAVLAFNPADLSEEQSRHAAQFWVRQIAACLDDLSESSDRPGLSYSQNVRVAGRGRGIVLTANTSETSDNSPGNQNYNRYAISLAQGASNQVMEHLYLLPQMRPLSIWWVILTLSALAVLLGPVDYLVLKRLDRLPCTWLTSAGWIAVFTVGAYYGVQWLRGGAMELRAVSVVDGIADSNCAWATCYSGLFVPRSDDYRLEGLLPNQWWSGIAPTQEEIYGFQRETALRQLYCVQQDGANLPSSVPINIWTVQSLISEWSAPEMPFTATVKHVDDKVLVTIENRSEAAIRAGYVVFEEVCADLGPVPARSTRQFEGRTRPFQPWRQENTYLRSPAHRRVTGFIAGFPRYPGSLGGTADSAFFAEGTLSRTLAMHSYLRFGAALVCVAYDEAPAPFRVKDCAYRISHIQLARQLVRNSSPSGDDNPQTP